jgi:exodeoxyribonuclease VII small subunit
MSEPANFEDALAHLEGVLRSLEDGTTGLDDALLQYEHGVRLLKYCYTRLQLAEQKILVLTAPDEAGGPTLRTFEHTASIDSEKAELKRPVRRRPPPAQPSESLY